MVNFFVGLFIYYPYRIVAALVLAPIKLLTLLAKALLVLVLLLRKPGPNTRLRMYAHRGPFWFRLR